MHTIARLHAQIIRHKRSIAPAVEALAKEGLSVTRFLILCELDRMGGTSLTQSALSSSLLIDRSTMTTTAATMERHGLIARCRGERDSRAMVLALTAKGRDAIARGAAALASLEKRSAA